MPKDKLYILDAGCAYGFVTRDRFSEIPDSVTLGVDINEKCLDYARQHNQSDSIHYEYLSFECEEFEEKL